MYRRRNLIRTFILIFCLVGLNAYSLLAEDAGSGKQPDLFSLYDYLAGSPLLDSSRTSIQKEMASAALYQKQQGPSGTISTNNSSYSTKLYDIRTRQGNEQNLQVSPSLKFTPSAASGLSFTYGYTLSKSYDNYASLDSQTHSLGLALDIDTLIKRDYLNDLKTLEISLQDAKLTYKQQLDQFYLTMLELLTAYYQTEYNLAANNYQLAIEEQEKNRLQIQSGINSSDYLKEINTIDKLKQQINLNKQELEMLDNKAQLYMNLKPAEIRFAGDEIITKLKAKPLPELTFEQFKAIAGQQPEISQIEDALIKKDIEIKRINQELIPDLSFQANYSYNTRTQQGILAETENKQTGSTNSFSLSLGVSVPVDKYLTNQSELDVKNLEKKQLLEQKSEKLISLYYTYQKSLQDYNSALNDLANLQATKPVLQKTLDDKEQLYAKGVASAFDVQQAKAELTSNQKQLTWKVLSLFNSYENNTRAYRGYLKEEK